MNEERGASEHPAGNTPRLFKRPLPGLPYLMRAWLAALCQFRACEREQLPVGAVIYACNHLSYYDPVVMSAALGDFPGFTARKYRRTWLAPFFYLGSPVWVDQDAPDRQALRRALAILRAGHCFGVAVEGRRSRTGGLQPGRDGAAYLATRAGLPVVPIAIYGTEQLFRSWRPAVRLCVGAPLRFPAGRASARQLTEYTERIMCAIAALLPERYHGVYRDHPLIGECGPQSAASPC